MNKKSINASGLDAGRGSNTQSIVFSGLLVATSIIFTRFLGFMAFGGAVRISFGGLQHALNMPCAGGNGGGVGAVGRAGAAAD